MNETASPADDGRADAVRGIDAARARVLRHHVCPDGAAALLLDAGQAERD